jgi:TonB family protein
MRARLAPYDGQPHTLALRAEVMRLAREVDAQARVGEVLQTPELTTLWITLVQNEPGAPSSPTTGIPVSGAEQSQKLISQVSPVYPPLARQARLQGTVRFSAVIDKEGRVTNLTLVSGHPLLVQAAVEAVKQWVYQPTLLNGQPVEVTTQIDLNFTLAGGSPPPAQ